MNKKNATDEQRAMGMFFGVSNLAMVYPDSILEDIVTNNAPDWRRVYSLILQKGSSYLETDAMYDGMMDEVEWWINKAKDGDDYMQKEWSVIVTGESRSRSRR